MGMANGISLSSGCEFSMRMWEKDFHEYLKFKRRRKATRPPVTAPGGPVQTKET